MNIPEQTTIPDDVLQRLSDSMKKLEDALLHLDPNMPNHLRESHKLLTSYPETVPLLDDKEIQNLILAAQVYTNTKIVESKTTKAKAAASKVSRMSADDI